MPRRLPHGRLSCFLTNRVLMKDGKPLPGPAERTLDIFGGVSRLVRAARRRALR